MLEIKITVVAPELATAINSLAKAVNNIAVHPQTTSSTPKPEPKGLASSNAEPKGLPAPASPISEPARSPIPLAQPQQYTVDQIMEAGASLMDAGKVEDLMNLLHSFGVQAVMDLKPEQLGAFAAALRAHGARI